MRSLLTVGAAALMLMFGACSEGDSDSAEADHCDVFREADAERLLEAPSVEHADFLDLVEKGLPDDAARAQAEAAGKNICAYRTGEVDPPKTPVAAYQFGPGGFDSPQAFYDVHDSGERVEDGLGRAAIYESESDVANDDGSRAGGAVTVLLDDGETFTLAVYNASVSRKTLLDVARVIAGRL